MTKTPSLHSWEVGAQDPLDSPSANLRMPASHLNYSLLRTIAGSNSTRDKSLHFTFQKAAGTCSDLDDLWKCAVLHHSIKGVPPQSDAGLRFLDPQNALTCRLHLLLLSCVTRSRKALRDHLPYVPHITPAQEIGVWKKRGQWRITTIIQVLWSTVECSGLCLSRMRVARCIAARGPNCAEGAQPENVLGEKQEHQLRGLLAHPKLRRLGLGVRCSRSFATLHVARVTQEIVPG